MICSFFTIEGPKPELFTYHKGNPRHGNSTIYCCGAEQPTWLCRSRRGSTANTQLRLALHKATGDLFYIQSELILILPDSNHHDFLLKLPQLGVNLLNFRIGSSDST